MKELIESLAEKVSAYNIFNYLFPGAVFLVGLGFLSPQPLPQCNAVVCLLVAYFAGMTLSRVGSLVIEPFLRKIRFVRYCDYGDFVKAERADPKVATLSQENNTFRTLIAVFFGLLAAEVGIAISQKYPEAQCVLEWAWPIAFLCVFLFAYRKQTAYIVKRVANLGK
jgi:hypothetical protein